MLFYSFHFLYIFLPLVLVAALYAEWRIGRKAAILVLVFSSFLFYGSWNSVYVPLLAASVIFNYYLGCRLQDKRSKALLWLGIACNLGILAYFKYANFFIGNLGLAFPAEWRVGELALPLGLSFYTFQQIAWLCDSHARNVDTKTEGFWRYALFVTFFPHLVAGPLVSHADMMPQFSKKTAFRPKWSSAAVGLTIFVIGLSKKVILADEFGAVATPIFGDAATGLVPLASAWQATLCYTFQVYFDFSGYSDMAIGLARLFNIRLPANFNSPFKASSIIELWKRWHMTMTRFFQTYVFMPLCATLLRRQLQLGYKGNAATYISTFVTLVAIGLWHGASWTFILFGALQGAAIIVNHVWRALQKRKKLRRIPAPAGVFMTYLFFAVSCILYRAEDLTMAGNMFASLLNLDVIATHQFKIEKIGLWLVGAFICFGLPNTQQIMKKFVPVLDKDSILDARPGSLAHKLRWRPNWQWQAVTLLLCFTCLNLLLDSNRVQEFIYYQF